MATYTVDPSRFQAAGAIVDWQVVAKRLGQHSANQQPEVQLRWLLHQSMGLPTEPFQVWARHHTPAGVETQLTIQQRQLQFLSGLTMITWPGSRSMSTVRLDLVAASGGVVAAFAGAPFTENMVAAVSLAPGATAASLSAPVIDGLLISGGVTVNAAYGIETGALSAAAGWTLIETVGIPVTQADWGGIGKHGEPQGLTGSITDAQTAAVQRLTRGAPPFGWSPTIASGIAAPPWTAPDFHALVAEVNQNLLDRLKGIAAGFAPDQQAAQQVPVLLPAPRNLAGEQMTAPGSTSMVAPLPTTLMAAGSDPFLSLVLGFGTAYAYNPHSLAAAGAAALDYMVTAHWENGLDGASAPVDYAAIVAMPGPAQPPPPPANAVTEVLGILRPLSSDGDWRSSVRLSWDRPPIMQLFRVASVGAARANITPAAPTDALMQQRASGGFQPIGVNQSNNTPDPEFWRLHVVDREVPVPSNPGSRQVKYAAAVQDLYGQWTPWASVDATLQQPDLEPVRIVSATLRPNVPASGAVCTTALDIEFLWDWRVRTPLQISIVGSLYAASSHGAPPPSLAVPGGLDRSLGGGGAPLVVTFAGDTPSAPGASIIALDEGGEQQVTFGTAQGTESRRYRLTLEDLSLDFGVSGFIGLALWAQGQERIAPQRISGWPEGPVVITAADPRPPVIPVDHVTLASLPDTAGQCHARISWTPQPNAAGYFVYEAAETTLLLANGLPEPALDQTLDDRLKTLKDAFHANPSRREFTRLNATLLQGADTDVSLPRGSTAIHVYVVLGVSAGQVESDWPAGATPEDALIAVAAPHIMSPAAPTIEVHSILDGTVSPPVYRAELAIATRPGPRPKRIDVHRVRVDDAAVEIDTMGPPIARVTASSGPWTVSQDTDSDGVSFIRTAQGQDAPAGSWKRVWYRAAAWTVQDDTRGALPGRSPASNAAWVVLPPPDAPSVSPLALGGGSAPADVLIQWTCDAPVARTPLGPHTISVRATLVGAPPRTDPLLSLDSTLDGIGTTPPPTDSGVWIESAGSGPTVYRALIRRAAVTDSIKFVVRITDPIGRTGESLVTVAPGPVDPAPDLSNLVVRKLPGLPIRTGLSFVSSVPLVAPLDGPYHVRVAAVLRGFPPPHPPFPFPFPVHPPLVLDIPAGSVPTMPVMPEPPIEIVRQPGAGPAYTYDVLCMAAIAQFNVRISAPDGRFVEQTQNVVWP